MQLKINQDNIGKRLDIFLVEKVGKISRSQWQKKIKDEGVVVNGKKASKHYGLKKGDKIEIKSQKTEVINKVEEIKFEVDIVCETNDYIVLNKPAGMVTHPDNINKGNTLADWLIKRYPEIKGVGEGEQRWGIVHRLDKEVSGLIVAAKNQEMFENLKKQFQARKIKKEYMALVHNQMQQDEGEVNLAIGRSKKKGILVAMGDLLEGLMYGRQALTKYEVVKKFRNFTLIKVSILTGRTHQIRVHLRAIGHAVVGDKLYATHDVRLKKKGVDLGRLWLYAVRLGFKDLNGEWVEYKVDRPKELDEFLKSIK